MTDLKPRGDKKEKLAYKQASRKKSIYMFLWILSVLIFTFVQRGLPNFSLLINPEYLMSLVFVALPILLLSLVLGKVFAKYLLKEKDESLSFYESSYLVAFIVNLLLIFGSFFNID
jgi:hypothetical protein